MAILMILMSVIATLFIIWGETLFQNEDLLYDHFKDFAEGYFTTFVLLTQVSQRQKSSAKNLLGRLGRQIRLWSRILRNESRRSRAGLPFMVDNIYSNGHDIRIYHGITYRRICRYQFRQGHAGAV